jgi:hypothetical protein
MTSTTLDIYGHLIPVMQEEAARIMDELITPIPVDLSKTANANQFPLTYEKPDNGI